MTNPTELPKIDPNTLPVDDGSPPTNLQTDPDVMAAMDAGISGEPAPAPAPAVVEPPKKPDPTAEELAAAAALEAENTPDPLDPANMPGTPEHTAAQKTKDDAAKAEADKAALETPEAKAEAERKAELDKQLDADGLRNQKTRERIHTLSATVAQQAPMIEALTKAGVKDVKEVAVLVENGKSGREIFERVLSTGMDADMYIKTLDYGANAVAAAGGDLVAARTNFESLKQEMKFYADILGEDVPGIADPLAAHKDLLQDLEDGNITRAHALEIARSRAGDKVQQDVRKREDATRQQQDQNTQEVNNGKASLTALGNELAKADGTVYKALQAALIADLPRIAKEFPPSQWVAAARLTYDKLKGGFKPTPAPVAKPAGNVGPLSSAGPKPAMNKKFANAEDAMDAAMLDVDSGH